jgi:hypothetical protein
MSGIYKDHERMSGQCFSMHRWDKTLAELLHFDERQLSCGWRQAGRFLAHPSLPRRDAAFTQRPQRKSTSISFLKRVASDDRSPAAGSLHRAGCEDEQSSRTGPAPIPPPGGGASTLGLLGDRTRRVGQRRFGREPERGSALATPNLTPATSLHSRPFPRTSTRSES